MDAVSDDGIYTTPLHTYSDDQTLMVAWHTLMLGYSSLRMSTELQRIARKAHERGADRQALYWDHTADRYILLDELSPERHDTFAGAIQHSVEFNGKITITHPHERHTRDWTIRARAG